MDELIKKIEINDFEYLLTVELFYSLGPNKEKAGAPQRVNRGRLLLYRKRV